MKVVALPDRPKPVEIDVPAYVQVLEVGGDVAIKQLVEGLALVGLTVKQRPDTGRLEVRPLTARIRA